MADISVNGSSQVDITRWKRLTPQEIIKEEGNGAEIPAEILAWAEQMAAFYKIPDNVTYEQVDGDVGIDALNKLGIDDIALAPENGNATLPVETEEPDAVKDIDKPEDTDNDEGKQQVGDLPASITEEETNNEEVFSLANDDLTADNDEIRKRKERKGIL